MLRVPNERERGGSGQVCVVGAGGRWRVDVGEWGARVLSPGAVTTTPASRTCARAGAALRGGLLRQRLSTLKIYRIECSFLYFRPSNGKAAICSLPFFGVFFLYCSWGSTALLWDRRDLGPRPRYRIETPPAVPITCRVTLGKAPHARVYLHTPTEGTCNLSLLAQTLTRMPT